MTEPSGLEPALPADDTELFDWIEALWRLNHFIADFDLAEVEEFATLALVRGFDGPALRELAWRHDSWSEIAGLVDKALVEMGRVPVLTPAQALRYLTKRLAKRVVDGSLELMVGAVQINSLFGQAHWKGIEFDADWRELDDLLERWPSHPRENAQTEVSVRTFVHALAQDRPTDSRAVDPLPVEPPDWPPALGGARAASANAPSATSDTPDQPPDEGWRFEFHFNVDFNVRRFFRWDSSSHRRP